MNIDSFLTQLCEHCGLSASDVEIEVEESDEKVIVNLSLPESESGLFIGYHGETLDSVQRILRLVFQREADERRLILNINNYREQRQEKLAEMAKNIAKKVLESGREETIGHYLPSHERFIVHSAISDDADLSEKVESVSSGQGRQRRISIRLKS